MIVIRDTRPDVNKVHRWNTARKNVANNEAGVFESKAGTDERLEISTELHGQVALEYGKYKQTIVA